MTPHLFALLAVIVLGLLVYAGKVAAGVPTDPFVWACLFGALIAVLLIAEDNRHNRRNRRPKPLSDRHAVGE